MVSRRYLLIITNNTKYLNYTNETLKSLIQVGEGWTNLGQATPRTDGQSQYDIYRLDDPTLPAYTSLNQCVTTITTCPGVPICNGHGICENGICHCLHGHTGNGCEIPPYGYVIDNPCHADPICNGHGSCSQGGTVCNCLHGYTGNGCEIQPYYHTTTKKSSMYSC